jgi:endonuclease YncB( thermonuclease family)
MKNGMTSQRKTHLYIIPGIVFLFILFGYLIPDAKNLYLVKWVDDGDTIKLTDGRRIRLLGINSPEIAHKDSDGKLIKAEPFGSQAKNRATILTHGKKVYLELDKEKYDRYGRVLAYVFLPDGTFINKKLIEEGLAYCLPDKTNNRYEQELLKAQQNAMRSGIGLWHNLKKASKQQYIGNTVSKRFHSLECPFGKKIALKNRKVFTHKWDAFYEGFAPCKKCATP